MGKLQGFIKPIHSTTLRIWRKERDEIELAWDGRDILLYQNGKYLRKITDIAPIQIEAWDSGKSYLAGDNFVSYKSPNYQYLEDDNPFKIEYIYRAVENTSPGQSPETHEDKWLRQGKLGEQGENTIFLSDVSGLEDKLEAIIKYSDLSDDFSINSETKKVSLNIDYVTLTNFSGKDYIQPDTLPKAAISTSSDSLLVLEGNTISMQVNLSRKPTSDVTLSITSSDASKLTTTQSSLVFTPDDYDLDKTININTVIDTDSIDENESIEIAIDNTLDSNYSSVSPKVISVEIIDKDNPGLVVSNSSITMLKGSDYKFTVELSSEPSNDVSINIFPDNFSLISIDISSITFNSTNWNIPVEVTVSALYTGTKEDESTNIVIDTSSIDSQYNSLNENITVNANYAEPAKILTSSENLNIVGGSTRGLGVKLNRKPIDNITVQLTIDDPSIALFQNASSAQTSITFTRTNYDIYNYLIIEGFSNVGEPDKNFNILLEVTSSLDNAYIGKTKDISGTVVAPAEKDVILSTNSITVEENNSVDFSVVLSAEPSEDVQILYAGYSEYFSLSPASITFDPFTWDIPRDISIITTKDDSFSDQNYNITLDIISPDSTYSSLNSKDIDLTITDIDSQSSEIKISNTIWKASNSSEVTTLGTRLSPNGVLSNDSKYGSLYTKNGVDEILAINHGYRLPTASEVAELNNHPTYFLSDFLEYEEGMWEANQGYNWYPATPLDLVPAGYYTKNGSNYIGFNDIGYYWSQESYNAYLETGGLGYTKDWMKAQVYSNSLYGTNEYVITLDTDVAGSGDSEALANIQADAMSVRLVKDI